MISTALQLRKICFRFRLFQLTLVCQVLQEDLPYITLQLNVPKPAKDPEASPSAKQLEASTKTTDEILAEVEGEGGSQARREHDERSRKRVLSVFTGVSEIL